MSAHTRVAPSPPIDFAKWRQVPNALLFGGGAVTLLGLILCLVTGKLVQFGYAWLLGFMVCLSLTLGALFLVLAHHLFDAG